MYKLKLNELLRINPRVSIRRVPGGWIYIHDKNEVYVPYNNEFENI